VSAETVLSAQDLTVRYGGVLAVEKLTLQVGSGQRVALIGANGAGKSSTLKCFAGLVPASSGMLHYRGADLQGVVAWRRAQQGLVLVPEGRGIFLRMTVQENLLMGAWSQRHQGKDAQALEEVYELFSILSNRRQQIAGYLSGGEQQLLALGRALLAKPQMLMLDEPSMGLAPLMVDKVYMAIETILSRGVSLLLVEQNAALALEFCDWAYVMASGQLVLSDTALRCQSNDKVRQAYLGESI
jgi:branched-chain amino acid transport system ATP-binding protein